MRDDTVHSDVLRLQISGVNFPFLTNVAMKLSHTLLLVLEALGVTVALRNLKHLMTYCTFSGLYPLPISNINHAFIEVVRK
jgi:hypothetical protein